MALEDEILKAGHILDDAFEVVKKGTSIFDEVKQTLSIITPVPTTPTTPPISSTLQTASEPLPGTSNIGLLIVIGVIAYIVLS